MIHMPLSKHLIIDFKMLSSIVIPTSFILIFQNIFWQKIHFCQGANDCLWLFWSGREKRLPWPFFQWQLNEGISWWQNSTLASCWIKLMRHETSEKNGTSMREKTLQQKYKREPSSFTTILFYASQLEFLDFPNVTQMESRLRWIFRATLFQISAFQI